MVQRQQNLINKRQNWRINYEKIMVNTARIMIDKRKNDFNDRLKHLAIQLCVAQKEINLCICDTQHLIDDYNNINGEGAK